MPPTTINDINLKQFYIYDSLKSPTISTAMEKIDSSSFSTYENPISSGKNSMDSSGVGFSYISTNPSNDLSKGYVKKGPFDLFDLNSELSNRYNKLIAALDILQRCDRITKYIITNNQSVTYANNGYFYPNPTQSGDPNYIKFTNDMSGCSAFNSDFIINHTGGSNDSFPTTVNGNIFKKYMYTQNANTDKNLEPDDNIANTNIGIKFYPKFASEHIEFDNKDIGQMVGDIKNLMQNYSMILKYYSGTPLDKQIDNAPDYNMSKLQQIQSNNVNLRQELDQKVQYILAGKDTIKNANNETRYYMDSTIYANIMWSILATSLIYFVLVKI